MAFLGMDRNSNRERYRHVDRSGQYNCPVSTDICAPVLVHSLVVIISARVYTKILHVPRPHTPVPRPVHLVCTRINHTPFPSSSSASSTPQVPFLLILLVVSSNCSLPALSIHVYS